MDLKRALVGAIVGAAIGLGLHLVVGAVAKTEAVWFAILIGAFTGLGVWQAYKGIPRTVSYARGAISAVIALIAILASVYLVRVAIAKSETRVDLSERPPLQEGEVRTPVKPPAISEDSPAEDSPDKEPGETGDSNDTEREVATETDAEEPGSDAETTEDAATPPIEQLVQPTTAPKVVSSSPAHHGVELKYPKVDIWEFVCIALGVFLAYELARGTGNRPLQSPESIASA